MYILATPVRKGSGEHRRARRPLIFTKVQKWGNSQGVRFPLRLLEQANLAVGDEVDVTVQEGRIVVTRSDRIRGRYRLEELVARMPEGYEPVEEDWGAPVGREVW